MVIVYLKYVYSKHKFTIFLVFSNYAEYKMSIFYSFLDHNSRFQVDCKTCFCYDGEVTCSPKQCWSGK